MIIEKIDRKIEFDIPYDILDAAVHRCLSNTVRGFVDFEREEPTRATIIYVLSQFQLGIFAKIRIDKLGNERTSMSLFELREPFTPKQKQKYFEGNDSLKNKTTRLIIEGLEQSQSLSEQRRKHFDNVIENLFNQLDQESIWSKEYAKNQSPIDISQNELLARNFENWQKQYYDDVYSFYEKRDEHRLVIAFNLWEDRFIQFLEDSLPKMVGSYKTQTSQFMPLEYYGGSLENFKPVKSDKVEAFLAQCIVDARKGNLVIYHVLPKKNKRTTRNSTSTKKKSNQKQKSRVVQSAANITNIYVGGDVGGHIVVGDENRIENAKAIFQNIYEVLEASSRDATEKRDLVAEVDEIKDEVAKGDQANESFLSRRLRNLKKMAPDIAEVTLATLANPVAGVGMAIQKIAKKIKEETK